MIIRLSPTDEPWQETGLLNFGVCGAAFLPPEYPRCLYSVFLKISHCSFFQSDLLQLVAITEKLKL